MSVTRIFVEKKPGFDVEAKHIQTDLTENLGIRGIEELRLLHRYDVEGLSQKEQEDANRMIFSEPNVDHLYGEDLQFSDDYHVFAMEYLPGQYDQRTITDPRRASKGGYRTCHCNQRGCIGSRYG